MKPGEIEPLSLVLETEEEIMFAKDILEIALSGESHVVSVIYLKEAVAPLELPIYPSFVVLDAIKSIAQSSNASLHQIRAQGLLTSYNESS